MICSAPISEGNYHDIWLFLGEDEGGAPRSAALHYRELGADGWAPFQEATFTGAFPVFDNNAVPCGSQPPTEPQVDIANTSLAKNTNDMLIGDDNAGFTDNAYLSGRVERLWFYDQRISVTP